MKTTLEIVAGLTLAGTFSVGVLTLMAFELGRALQSRIPSTSSSAGRL
jgi:hypothetical protein